MRKINIKIGNVVSQLEGLNDTHHLQNLDKILSYYVEGYFHTRAYKVGFFNKATGKRERWDGKKHLLSKRKAFPSGLLHYVEEYFQKQKIEYSVEDIRYTPAAKDSIPIICDFEYRLYQERCVEAALREKCCIIQAATGSGKSYIAAKIIGQLNLKSIIYVHTVDLLYQMIEDLKEYLGIDAGQIGDKKIEIKPITVALVQSVSRAFDKKYVKCEEDEKNIKIQLKVKDKAAIRQFVKESEVFIFDEAHHLSADSCQLIAVESINARYRIGLSGTAWRDDGADLLIEAATGTKAAIVTATELIDLGILVRPEIFIYLLPRYLGTETDYRSIYRDYVVENQERHIIISKLAYELARTKKKKLLILVKFIKHGEELKKILQEYVSVEFVKGSLSSQKRDKIKKRFLANDLEVIVATSLYDEGVNLPALDALILAGGGKSSTKAMQRIGRTLRKYPGKNKSIIIDLCDQAPYLDKHTKKRMKMYQSEPGFTIKEVGF